MSRALVQKTEFYSVWHKFVTTGATEGVPGDIKASWMRCREMGFDPQNDITPVHIDQQKIKKKIEQHLDLHHLLISHYKDIERKFDFFPFVTLFTDAEGHVLSINGHDNILKLLESGTVRAGSSIHESVIGTTAPGVCLAECRPSTVFGEGHYSHLFHWASCFAIPMLDHERNIIGCLDFTTTSDYRNKFEYLVPYFLSVAYSLQFEFFLKRKLQEFELFDFYFRSTFEYASSVMMLIDRNGNIINLNRKAQTILGIAPNKIINRHVSEVLDIDSRYLSFIKGTGVSKFGFLGSTNSGIFSAKSMPIFDHSGNEVAYLLKLDKEQTGVVVPGKDTNTARYTFNDIIGSSKQIVEAISQAKKVAKTPSNVLIEGETGTGKEIFAHAIHHASQFSRGPFIALNCAAIPHELIESELFGYTKGAYTGAHREGNIGKFELANGGTLFLDEIHTMDLPAQMKILRVVEDRHVTKIGGKSQIPLNIRIIVASTANLEDEVEKGNFLPALYFRLNVVRLQLPLLKERKEDIPILVDYFIKEANKKFNRSIGGIDPEALKVLSQYSWPGNMRELKNAIESAFNFCSGGIIGLDHLTNKIKNKPKRKTETGGTIDELTKNLLAESIQRFGNVKEAANALGISVSTFYRKMKRYGLSK